MAGVKEEHIVGFSSGSVSLTSFMYKQLFKQMPCI